MIPRKVVHIIVMLSIVVLFSILLTFLATGINGIPGSEPDLSRSCHNMTWACHDLETCLQCEKLVGCVEVWQQIRAPKDNNEICGMCNSVVRQAKQKLLADETQNVEDIFEASCKLQTTEELRDKCFRIIDEFGSELADILNSDVDCNTLCTMAGLCNKGNALQLIREQYLVSAPLLVPLHRKVNCPNCEPSVKSDPEVVNSSPQDEFVKELSIACANLFEKNAGQCQEVANQMGPVFYDALLSEADRLGDSVKCKFCQIAVGYLKGVLESSSTKEKCKENLLAICGHWAIISAQCGNFVDQYFDQIYDFLLNQMDSLHVCKLLQLCPNESSFVNHIQVVRVIPLVSSHLMYTSVRGVRIEPLHNRANEVKENVETDTFAEIVSEPNSNNFITCELCKQVMAFLEKKLGENRTEEGIRKALSKVCSIVPNRWRNKCTDLVDSHVDLIVSLLKTAANPSVICKVIRVCSSEPEGLVQTSQKSETDVENNHLPVLKHKSNDFLTCEICKQVMEYLEKELGDNRTEEAIREVLDKACNALPRLWRSKCTDFIDSHVDMIVDLLVHAADPSTICSTLGVCSSEPKNQRETIHTTQKENGDNKLPDATEQRLRLPVKHIQTPSDGIVSCKLCKTLISFVERQLKNKRVEDDIRNALDEGCKIFPKDMERQCQHFVDKNVDTLVSLIIQESSPNAICSVLKACSVETSSKPNDILTCELCKLVMNFLEKELGNNRTEEAIRKALDKVCDVLPRHWRGKCTHFVDKYADSIVDLLKKEVAPSMVCKALGVCFLEPESHRQLFHWKRRRTEKRY